MIVLSDVGFSVMGDGGDDAWDSEVMARHITSSFGAHMTGKSTEYSGAGAVSGIFEIWKLVLHLDQKMIVGP